eukprot:403368960
MKGNMFNYSFCRNKRNLVFLLTVSILQQTSLAQQQQQSYKSLCENQAVKNCLKPEDYLQIRSQKVGYNQIAFDSYKNDAEESLEYEKNKQNRGGYQSINSDFLDIETSQKAVIVNIESGYGLGNQMFRYAAGYSISKTLGGAEIWIYDGNYTQETYEKRNYGTEDRAFALDNYNISYARILNYEEYAFFIQKAQFVDDYQVYNGIDLNFQYFHAHDHFSSDIYFNNSITEVLESLNLNDHAIKSLQAKSSKESNDYFEKIKNQIIKASQSPPMTLEQFKLKNQQQTQSNAQPDLLKDLIPTVQQSVMMHVRGGDFKKRKKNLVLPQNYYFDAFGNILDKLYEDHKELDAKNPILNKIIKQRYQSLKLFVFTDDIEHFQTLQMNSPNVIIVSNNLLNSLQEFELMRLCQHFIIANSTFSWWVAYLAQYKEKMIFAPSIMIGDKIFNKYEPKRAKFKKDMHLNHPYPSSWFNLIIKRQQPAQKKPQSDQVLRMQQRKQEMKNQQQERQNNRKVVRNDDDL